MTSQHADNLNPTVRVLAAVVRRHGHYLICQRPINKRHGGLWEFPGGKIEGEESTLAAARRELAEELDVHVTGIEQPLFSAADPGSEFVIDFVPTSIEGEPRCLEHLEFRWLLLREMLTMPLAPSDQRFVEFLLASSSSTQEPV